MTRNQPYVNKAMMYKYSFMAIPAMIIVVNFFMVNRMPKLQYLSIVALCVYAFLFMFYRFRTVYAEPSSDIVTSPINGKVSNVQAVADGAIVTIKKPYFAPCEIVTCTASDIPNKLEIDSAQVSWQVTGYTSRGTGHTSRRYVKVFIAQTIAEQGILVGMAPGSVTMEVFIPATFSVQVVVGEEIIAGQTTLASIASDSEEAI